MQLLILERNLNEGNGNPNKQKIKEITSEMRQHGSISKTNVYNWFQNRRARSKRRQQIVAPTNNAESEVKTNPQDFQFQHNSDMRPEHMCNESSDIGSSLYYNKITSYDDMLTSSCKYCLCY